MISKSIFDYCNKILKMDCSDFSNNATFNQTKENIWMLIESYFKDKHLENLVRHQLESYNNFVNYQIMKTIEMFNPVYIVSPQDYDEKTKMHSLEIFITFKNFNIYRPQIHENNGAIKLMFPQETRLRNFTYSSNMTVDLHVKYVVRSGEDLSHVQTFHKVIPKIQIGKIPIMLKSNICILSQYKHVDNIHTGECKFDAGGYFIINGSEKIVLGQERAAENRIYCFNVAKHPKYSWMAEIKSVPDFKCISPKQINMFVVTKNNGFGNPIMVQISRVKQVIPLCIVFRALGVITDKEICEMITLNSVVDEKTQHILKCIQASIVDANQCLTKEDSIRHIMASVMYTPMNMDRETGAKKKYDVTLDILSNDLFPHCSTLEQKKYFLGYMAHRLIKTSIGILSPDDRDSYLNKRVDLTGSLLNNLFRNYFNKLVKDAEKQIIREVNTGSWRSTEDYSNIITMSNINKIIKSNTIENGLKKALSTGDFSIKHSNTSKVGVAQVLTRLTYISAISHSRRISTPIDKSGKLIPPRKLHNTSWGFLCCSETPEGQSVGVVKNLSYMTHVTIHSNSIPIYDYVSPFVMELANIKDATLIHNSVKVFVNGCWLGITEQPLELYGMLKARKHNGTINIYTSIVFDYLNKEIRVCNDSGRLTRPVLRVKNNNIFINEDILSQLEENKLSWDDMLNESKTSNSVIEYIDPEEQSMSLIAMNVGNLIENEKYKLQKFTHCEIHPSTMFGVAVSCIPFPDHNQSPRNTYQAAQSKQAIGVYVSNYHERMDKTAYVLSYAERPLVETRVMNMLKIVELPAGNNVTVAIMTHTGYNQEDSLLINKGSIDRGMFLATVYHTEKDEDKQKINGDEEIRCKPDPTKTKGMKMANYGKLNADGVVPENTFIENRDIIIAKVTPIKENRNDPSKPIKFEDQSRMYRSMEETFIDKNYVDKNGDGYNMAKVRLRTTRKPVIGDKFCALPTQQVLTHMGWVNISDIDPLIHKCATIDKNNYLFYEYPTEKYKYHHDGDMYHVNTENLHITCTMNHKLYVNLYNTNNEDDDECNGCFEFSPDEEDEIPFSLIQASDVLGNPAQFQQSVNNKFKSSFMVSMNDVSIPTLTLIKLCSIYFHIGNYDHEKGEFKFILQPQTTSYNYDTVSEILIWMRIKFVYNQTREYISIKRNVYPSFDYIFDCYTEKRFPEFIWSLPEDKCIHFLELLCYRPHRKYSISCMRNFTITTHDEMWVNDISRLAIHCTFNSKTLMEHLPCHKYIIEIIMNNLQPIINVNGQQDTVIQYIGDVYCIEMPTSHIYISRETPFSPSVVIGNSSRSGQKGTVGAIIPEADMPYTESGIRPDIIINPHAIPSRMTMAQLKETLLCKVLVMLGLFGDGTSYGDMDVSTISEKLLNIGYEKSGDELLYNGTTGTQIECNVFVGPVFYQRLKHMVSDKYHSRSTGRMVNFTRQPAEGRSRDGGLRFGEMERDAIISHGASRFIRSRMYDVSDKYQVHVCKSCGMIASYNDKLHIHICHTCGNRIDFSYVEIPYACKLMFQELMTMNIVPRMITEH